MTPDPTDVRVLIPRVRRAIDGPAATGSGSVAATLDDEQVKALTADAIAAVIFYTGGLWSHALSVSQRDVTYGSPVEWAITPPLGEAEQTVVTAQAALDFYFHQLSELKTSETIRDEGQEWTWSTSAAAVAQRITALRDQRDRALELITAAGGVSTYFVSYLEQRDGVTAQLIEPYVRGMVMGSREGIWW